MALIRDILAFIFLVGGLAFMFLGVVGIVRFPDMYQRLHASTKCATLGLMGLLLGAVCQMGTMAVATKSLLVILFAFVANPVGSHILAKAAHTDGLIQWGKTLSDELAEDRQYNTSTITDQSNTSPLGTNNGDKEAIQPAYKPGHPDSTQHRGGNG